MTITTDFSEVPAQERLERSFVRELRLHLQDADACAPVRIEAHVVLLRRE